ncbi:MAG: hypothetical protein WDA07_14505, partial [Leucobacter sp.]
TVIVVGPFEVDVKSSLEGSHGDRRHVHSDPATRSVHHAIGRNHRPIPSDELLDELGRSGSTVSFLRMDYMMMRYATLYATAGFGEEIERVQWRIARERPNDFIHRFDEEQQFETPVTTFGWRQSNVRTDQSVINEYSALIDRYGGRPAFEKAAEHASK